LNEVREMGKRKNLSPRKSGQITVLLKRSDLKQKDIAKEVNILTQTASSVRKIRNWEERCTVQGWEDVDGRGKQHLDLTEKSKQRH